MKLLIKIFFPIFFNMTFLNSYATEENFPKNSKEYYDKYLKGQGHKTSYGEAFDHLSYSELSPFMRSEIKTEFKKRKLTHRKTILPESQEQILITSEQAAQENPKKIRKKKEKNSQKVKEIEPEKEELSITPLQEIQEEQIFTSKIDEVFGQLSKDETQLRNIASKIMNRKQTEMIVLEEIKAKHGQESFEIWQKLSSEKTWAEKKKELSHEDSQKLRVLFGSLDKAKMKINRKDFIVAEKVISDNPVAKAKHACRRGNITLVKDLHNKLNPYSIICQLEDEQVTGKLYKKNLNNKLVEPILLKKMYVAINISDILEKISVSLKIQWDKKKNDWDQETDGRLTTVTPTE